MRALTGGMSNAVFCCEKGAGRRVLLRCYGLNSNAFFDRSAELLAFKYLARNGLGPQLLGEFANGRIEEFLDAQTLTPELMRAPRMSAQIARQVAAMHALRPAGLDTAPQLLRTLQRWHAMARAGAQLPRSSSGDVDVIAQLDACVAELRARLAATPSPTVFCHNDLQYGNVMYTCAEDGGSGGSDGGSGGLYLIDYEYASYNPRGFDVGNHFCEWCADYRGAAPHALDAARFPSDAQRRAFCAAYLGESDGAAAAPRVDALMREAQEYALASHVLWACWGLAQARGGGGGGAAAAGAAAESGGGGGFDYAAYAR
ncbi:kinase-like domain-containing protein, partial [Tribonema minus]